MSYGEEEAINGDIVMLLVCLATALDDVHALNTVLAIQPLGIVLEKDGYLLIVENTALHDL